MKLINFLLAILMSTLFVVATTEEKEIMDVIVFSSTGDTISVYNDVIDVKHWDNGCHTIKTNDGDKTYCGACTVLWYLREEKK